LQERIDVLPVNVTYRSSGAAFLFIPFVLQTYNPSGVGFAGYAFLLCGFYSLGAICSVLHTAPPERFFYSFRLSYKHIITPGFCFIGYSLLLLGAICL